MTKIIAFPALIRSRIIRTIRPSEKERKKKEKKRKKKKEKNSRRLGRILTTFYSLRNMPRVFQNLFLGC